MAFFGPEMYFFIENNNDKSITVQSRDVSIGGFMMDPYFSSEIAPGKMIVDDMGFSSNDLEDNGIETLDTVELYFHVYETDSWGHNV